MKKMFWSATALTTLVGFSYACGSNGGAASPVGSAGTGLDNLQEPALSADQLMTLSSDRASLRLLLTDAPIDADNVFVTFCGVRVQSHGTTAHVDGQPGRAADAGADGHGDGREDAGAPTAREEAANVSESDAGTAAAIADAGASSGEGGWLALGSECHTFDLLALQNGITSELGFATLPPGAYGQIRLMLSEASIVVNGTELPLNVPSGVESGIKIIHGFQLEAGSLTTLALDFDAARSIHGDQDSGYILRPVIELAGERLESYQDTANRNANRPTPPAIDDDSDGSEPERATPSSVSPAEAHGAPDPADPRVTHPGASSHAKTDAGTGG